MLIINKMSKKRYEKEYAAGNISDNEITLVPDEPIDLSPYALKDNVDELLGTKVPTTRKINDKELSTDISLTASDVGADPAGSAATAKSEAIAASAEYASAASASAASADASAVSAANAATSASGAASNADSSATAAATSASAASTSATNAAGSATSAASSATSAEESASDAASYATNAEGSANDAAGYASAASTSATSAEGSANDAAGYAASAKENADKAETVATTKATAAQNAAAQYTDTEVAKKTKVQVKDSNSTASHLPTLTIHTLNREEYQTKVDNEEISNDTIYLVSDSGDIVSRSNIHVQTMYNSSLSVAALFNAAKPQGITSFISGDTGVIKTPLADGIYSYTAYVFDGTIWKAMDGNYDAENVYFTENIVITEKVGNINLVNGSGEIPSAGKNIRQVFEALWTQEKEPTNITYPYLVNNTTHSLLEIGSTVTPSYNVELNPGSYPYGPETGVTASDWTITFDTGSEVKMEPSGQFSNSITVEKKDYTLNVSVAHNGATNSPNTNLGNSRDDLKIPANANISSSFTIITGYKPKFYGFNTTALNIDTLTSDAIRALENSSSDDVAVGTETIEYSGSWTQFLYAVPNGEIELTSVINKATSFPYNVIKKYNVTINHVGTTTSQYTVYCITLDAAVTSATTTLELTWAYI
jgi:hypothetical protein